MSSNQNPNDRLVWAPDYDDAAPLAEIDELREELAELERENAELRAMLEHIERYDGRSLHREGEVTYDWHPAANGEHRRVVDLILISQGASLIEAVGKAIAHRDHATHRMERGWY